MALTKVRGSGLGTLGDGTASDTAIVFDGNAQDFHIGLDDSTDRLTMGLGSTLGTTSHMVIDANGHITKPLQPSFHVSKNANQTSLAINTAVTVIFQNEVFDVGSNFTSNTFTAPVTGKYFLTASAILGHPQTDATYIECYIQTSNRRYDLSLNDYDAFDSTTVYWTTNGAWVADMDENDTAYVVFYQAAGTAASFIYSSTDGTTFSGHLLG